MTDKTPAEIRGVIGKELGIANMQALMHYALFLRRCGVKSIPIFRVAVE